MESATSSVTFARETTSLELEDPATRVAWENARVRIVSPFRSTRFSFLPRWFLKLQY